MAASFALIVAYAALRKCWPKQRMGFRSMLDAFVLLWIASACKCAWRLRKYNRRLAKVLGRVGQSIPIMPSSPSLLSEAQLQENAGTIVDDPADNLHKTWNYNNDALVFAASARSVLLQMAHPYIAQGVCHHSCIQQDPHKAVSLRFFRTFGLMYPIWFGNSKTRREYFSKWLCLHRRIHGTIASDVGIFKAGSRYSAGDIRALWWVQATLTEGIVAYWHIMKPWVAESELQAFWKNQGRRGFLVSGIPNKFIAETYIAFEEEYVRMWADLGVAEQCNAVVAALESAGRGVASRWMMWSQFEESLYWLPAPILAKFPCRPFTLRLSMQLEFYLDLGLIALVRNVMPPNLLDQSYLVEMCERVGMKFSKVASLQHAIGRRIGMWLLCLSMGTPEGLNPDWTS